jgi:hypothetical protein
MAKKGKDGKGGKGKGKQRGVAAVETERPAAAAAPVAPPPLAPAPRSGPRSFADLVERVTVGRLCYGEPVSAGGRTIVPVTRVRASGGDRLDARPMGYIEVGADGTRFEPIHDPEAGVRMLRAAATAAITVAGAVAGLRALRRGGRRRLLSRGD